MSAVSVPLCLEHCLKNVKARVDARRDDLKFRLLTTGCICGLPCGSGFFLLWPLRTSVPRGRVLGQEFQRPSKSCRTCPDLFSEVSTKLSRFKGMLLTTLTYLSPDPRREFSLKLCRHRAREHCGRELCGQL